LLKALSAFFMFGALAAGLSAITLTIPGSPLDFAWRLNPEGHAALRSFGVAGAAVMATVSLACLLTAYGLWSRAAWGRRLAIGILVVNLIGDAMNTVIRGDVRTLLGLPIGGAVIAYLWLPRTRAQFLLTPSDPR
jgi:hypothetical protein